MSSGDIEVLVIVRVPTRPCVELRRWTSRLHVVDGRGWFDDEYRESLAGLERAALPRRAFNPG